MTRRFEFAETKSNKFWEITVEGLTVSVRYGRIGTVGQSQTKVYTTASDSSAAAEKQVSEKVRKGYQEVAGSRHTTPEEAQGEVSGATVPKKATRKRQPKSDADPAAEALSWEQITAAIARADKREWQSLAKGVSLNELGFITITNESSILKRVDSQHQDTVALWALLLTGRLAKSQTLMLNYPIHEDLAALTNLPALRELGLLHSAITDLRGITSLSGLRSLNLMGCEELTSLEGVQNLTALTTLNLFSCVPFSLAALHNHPSLELLILRAREYEDWGEYLATLPETIAFEWQDEAGYEVDPEDWEGERDMFGNTGHEEEEEENE